MLDNFNIHRGEGAGPFCLDFAFDKNVGPDDA